MLAVYPTVLPDVLVIKRKISYDRRGFYAEMYSETDYHNAGITVKFVEDDFSFSKKNVLRGLHGDSKTWKLVSCPFGRLYFVVLNYDEESKFYGRWVAMEITPESCLQVLVPPRHANGHLVLSYAAIFHYKQSEYYRSADDQFVVKWNDPKFNISWPISETPILSARDSGKA